MAKKRTYKAEKTSDLLALELLGVKFVKLNKDGSCSPKKSKKGATHELSGTKLSSLIEPLRKAPKPPKEIVKPAHLKAEEEPAPVAATEASWHPPVPTGATWLEYSTSTASVMMPVTELESLRGFRGKIRFGRLRYGEDFVSMMPGEVGNITRWKDGVTCFAEGNAPAELAAKAKAAQKAAERAGQPLPDHVKAAFAAKTAARRVPPGPKPGDIAGLRQNGVRKPGAGGKTARVWEICDELRAKLGRTPTKAEVLAVSVDKEKASPGMSGTQFSYWRRFYGLTA